MSFVLVTDAVLKYAVVPGVLVWPCQILDLTIVHYEMPFMLSSNKSGIHTSFSSRSTSQDHLELWLSFVNFYVKQGGTPLLPYSYLSLEEYYRVTGLICMFALLELVFEVINSSIFQQNMFSFLCVGADEVGNWAGSGEILAAAHLFQLRIGVFQDGTDEQLTGWSWYPSIKHYPDSPVILLYNICGDHFVLVERVFPAIIIS